MMIYAALSIFLLHGDVIRQGFRPVKDESIHQTTRCHMHERS